MSTDRVTTVSPPQPAAGNGNGNGQGSLTELVSGIVTDAQHLIKQQVDMVRAEFKEDVRHTRQIAQYMGLGVGLLAVAGVMLLVALVYLVQYLTDWHLAGCWALVGGVCLVAGGVAVAVGARILAKNNPLPDKSLNALQENVSWLATNPQS